MTTPPFAVSKTLLQLRRFRGAACKTRFGEFGYAASKTLRRGWTRVSANAALEAWFGHATLQCLHVPLRWRRASADAALEAWFGDAALHVPLQRTWNTNAASSRPLRGHHFGDISTEQHSFLQGKGGAQSENRSPSSKKKRKRTVQPRTPKRLLGSAGRWAAPSRSSAVRVKSRSLAGG